MQQGKNWFYTEIQRLGYQLHLRQGWETKALRDKLGLKKNHEKLAERFDVHCLDSWVIANDIVGGHEKPDNTRVLYVKSNPVIRRQLHKLQKEEGSIRRPVGGTVRKQEVNGAMTSYVRGSLVIYKGRGLCILGGFTGDWENHQGTFTLNTLAGKEKYKLVKPDKIKFVAYHKWLIHRGTETKPIKRPKTKAVPSITLKPVIWDASKIYQPSLFAN